MIYQVMFYGGFALALVLLVVSIILFSKLHIGAVIGDVSGFTKKKQIERIRKEGIQREEDNFYSQAVGLKRSGALKPHSGKLEKKSRSGKLWTTGKTGKTTQQRELPKDVQEDTPTTPLEQAATQNQAPVEMETGVLASEEAATEVLDASATSESKTLPRPSAQQGMPENFEIVMKVISVHSDETI